MPNFHTILHRLRKRHIGKQLALAASVGCTEAAISLWESGKRLPQKRLVQRIVDRLIAGGAGSHEVQRAYAEGQGCRTRRRQPGRERPDF